jgi:hypothetical protein
MAQRFLGGVVAPATNPEPATRRYLDAAAKTFLPVANGTHFNGLGGGTTATLPQGRRFGTRKLLRVISSGADTLQVEWANIATSNTPQAGNATCELAGPNSVTSRMAVEYPAGNPRLVSGSTAWSSATAYALLDQVVSGGSKWVAIQAGTNQLPAAGSAFWRLVNTYVVNWEDQTDTAGTVTFAPGDYKRSQPIPLLETTRQGDCIAVLGEFDTGSTTNRVPYAGAAGASNTAPFVDWVILNTTALPAATAGTALTETGITNQTNGNTTTSGSTVASAWMQIPYATAVTGNIPNKRCVALFGDSLMQGTGGDVRDGEPCGIFPRSVDGSSWWRIAQGGNRAGCYVPGNAPWQMSVVARCTATITNLCMNDINANLTFAQVQANMITLWKMLDAAGPPVRAGYPTPISASSDAWATTANQSRFTNGGAINTTQNPTDDASYLTSVYGLISMWLSQDGATLALPDGTTVKTGERQHPLEGLVDWRGLIADPQTSWKWNPGYTSDGAHPLPAAVIVQAAYTASQMETVLLARQTGDQPFPRYNPQGEPPIQAYQRALVTGSSPSEAAAGSFATFIGVSPGRYYYGFRSGSGSATSAARAWTLFAGADPAKLKVVASGTTTPGASAIIDVAISGPVWVPAGYVVYLVMSVPITTANVYVGNTAPFAKLNQQGLGFITAGKSTDTAALTGVVSMFNATAGAKTFAPHAFRQWAELY